MVIMLKYDHDYDFCRNNLLQEPKRVYVNFWKNLYATLASHTYLANFNR